MANKKTSKKRKKISFEDAPIVRLKSGVKTMAHDPSEFFKNKAVVREALVQCLDDGDTDSYLEILATFFKIQNRSNLS